MLFGLFGGKDKRSAELYAATGRGDLTAVKEAIGKGADLNWRDPEFSETALHVAAEKMHRQILDELLDRGADPDIISNQGYTPLILAVTNGDGALPMVRRLVESRASLALAPSDGDNAKATPLYFAASMGANALVQYLLEAGSPLDTRLPDGSMLMHAAAIKGDAATINALVGAGIKIDVPDKQARNPLHIAAITGNQSAVETFLKKGVAVDCPDMEGCSPLMHAVLNNQPEVAKLLLQNGSDPGIVVESAGGAMNPLYAASLNGRDDLVKVLLEYGARVDARVGELHSVIEMTKLQGHESTVKLLNAAKRKQEKAKAETGKAEDQCDENPVAEKPAKKKSALKKKPGKSEEKAIGNEMNNLIFEKAEELNQLFRSHFLLQHDEKSGEMMATLAAGAMIKPQTMIEQMFGEDVASMAADIAEQTGEVSDKRIKQIGQSLIESFFEQIELEPIAEKPAKMKSALKKKPGKSEEKTIGNEMNNLIREKAAELIPLFKMCMALDQHDSLSEVVASMAADIASQTGEVSDERIKQIGQSLIELCIEQIGLESDDDGQGTEDDEPVPPIFQAVQEDDVKAVRKIFKKEGKDALEHVLGQITPLILAVHSGNEDMVRVLVEMGADVNHAPDSPTGQADPLTTACQGGHENIALYLLSHGANVNRPVWSAFEVEDGDSIRIENLTPLFTAAQAGAFGVCKALMEKGADVDPMTGHGFTPLMAAIKHHHNEVAEYLMEKGAKVDFPPPSKLPVDKWACLNPLLAAITNGNEAMVRLLLEKGVSLEVADNRRGSTPVKLAAMHGNLEIVNMLLAKGCPADVPDQDGWTALHNAAADGRADIVEALLAHGANPSTPSTNEAWDERGRTPLMDAAIDGYEDVVTLLLKAGANPNQASAAGSTPLGSSLLKGKAGTARILLEAGSAPCRPDAEGDQPLVNAIRHLMIARAQSDEVESDTELDELENLAGELINRGASLNTIESQSGLSMLQMAALTSDKLGLVLLDHGSDPSGADETDRAGLSGMVPSAFHLACEKKRLGMFKRLLTMGLDPLMKGPRGNSVLAVAAGSGFAEGIELLLDHPAVQASEVDEWLAAYRLAVRHGHRDIALRLIGAINERSDQQDQQDSHGYTPLMHAVAEGNLEKLNALLEAGADPDRLDLFAESALSFAMEKAIKQSDKGKKRRGRASAAAGNVYLAMVTSLVNQGAESIEDEEIESEEVDQAESIEDEGFESEELVFKSATVGALGTLLSKLLEGETPASVLLSLVDEDGNSPLNLAAANGHAGMVRVLPLLGADVDHCNFEGESAYHVARSRGFHGICETLAEYSAEDAASADGSIHWSIIPAFESRRSGPGKEGDE